MAFTFAAFSYICALIIDAFLIFFAIFHIISFDELKTDYKNPIDQCNSLNPLVIPEYALHMLFNLMFLFGGEWFSLCLNLPLIAYHINRYRTRPVMSVPGLYDPTNIMSHDVLNSCQREGWIKLAFYLLSFFYYLYGITRDIRYVTVLVLAIVSAGVVVHSVECLERRTELSVVDGWMEIFSYTL